MSDFIGIEELENKSICNDCIGDLFVKKWILKKGYSKECSYCEVDNKCMSLRDISNKVDGVYRENYELGEMQPSFFGDSDKPDWGRSGDSPEIIISNLLNASDELIAEDIQTVLENDESCAVAKDGVDPYYELTENYVETPVFDYMHSHLWSSFCDQVKHQSRFFNEGELLDELFTGILNLDFFGEADPFRIIDGQSAEKFIYRARRSETTLSRINICTNPTVELGSPPKRLATAGRMNPTGIPVFYGAIDRETCLSELRLSVGDLAISGKFEIIRPLRIMDLTLFDKLYQYVSYFDPQFEKKSSQLEFLRRFEREVSKPVLPDDEVLEYIPTQALIEYLSNYHTPKLDGLIYSSTQTDGSGKNIVIFNGVVSKVGKKITSGFFKEQNYGQSDFNYFISEVESDDEHATEIKNLEFEDAVSKEANLLFSEESLQIHKIRKVEHIFDSDKAIVSMKEDETNPHFKT